MMKIALLVALISATAILILRACALRLNWLDQPDARKVHQFAVPAIGGLAWLLAVLLGALVSGAWKFYPYLFAALVLIGILGAVDDRKPLPSSLRLMVQMIAALLAFWDSAILQNLGALFWPGSSVNLGVLAWPFTVFAAVGVINALNMIDGMDGLLGAISLVLLALLTMLFYRQGLYSLMSLCSIALSALIPFLFWNVRTPWLKSARVFFGDAGSMSLGLLIAWLLVQGASASALQGDSIASRAFTPSVALYLLAVPLIDTVSLMLRRIGQGVSPFRADQQHLHHLLQRAGFSVSATLALLLSACALFQVIGLGLHWLQVLESVQVTVFLVLALSAHFWIKHTLRSGRCLGRELQPKLAG